MTALCVLTALWQRHAVAEAVLRHTAEVKAQLAGDVDLALVAVGSEGKVSQQLAEKHGFYYVEAPNAPLSNKWNAGMVRARDIAAVTKALGVLIIGSDDIVTAGIFRAAAEAMKSGALVWGCIDMHYAERGPKVIFWPGYSGARAGDTIGCGRTLSSKMLQLCGWKPWPSGLPRSLDYHMMKRLNMLTRERSLFVATSMVEASGRMVDLKVDAAVDMSKFAAYEKVGEVVDLDAVLCDVSPTTLEAVRQLLAP